MLLFLIKLQPPPSLHCTQLVTTTPFIYLCYKYRREKCIFWRMSTQNLYFFNYVTLLINERCVSRSVSWQLLSVHQNCQIYLHNTSIPDLSSACKWAAHLVIKYASVILKIPHEWTESRRFPCTAFHKSTSSSRDSPEFKWLLETRAQISKTVHFV